MSRTQETIAFSILMATFDRAALLPRAIESVLRQTYRHWQLVIVDDGSRDTTPEILKEYSRRDARIQFVRQQNQGLVAARNRAARYARADWLTFLDSDDEYLPEHLELRAEILRANPHLDFLYGGVQIVGDPYVPDVHDPSRRIHLSECAIGGTFVIRKDAYIALGGFRHPDFGCDYELFQRAKKILSMEKVEFPTYVYHRDVQDSMCNRQE